MSAHAGGGGAEAEWTEAHDERYEWVTRRYAAATLAARARPPMGRRALREMARVDARVQLVWKRDKRKGTETPWVMVAPSAALRGTELLAHDPGLGLYAWRDFEENEIIGRYTGESLGVHSVCPFLSQTPDLALPPQSLPLAVVDA